MCMANSVEDIAWYLLTDSSLNNLYLMIVWLWWAFSRVWSLDQLSNAYLIALSAIDYTEELRKQAFLEFLKRHVNTTNSAGTYVIVSPFCTPHTQKKAKKVALYIGGYRRLGGWHFRTVQKENSLIPLLFAQMKLFLHRLEHTRV